MEHTQVSGTSSPPLFAHTASLNDRAPPPLTSFLAHPLLAKGVILPTPPIRELVTDLRKAVMLREQGYCFTATSGYGKSYGLAMAERELRRLFEDVPIYRHVIDNHQVPSIRAFFKHFLITVGETKISGETYDLRIRLEHRLIDSGRSSDMKLVVMLIDEAQEMALQDFQFLKDIGNHLEDAGVQLVVIMMGQDPDFTGAIDKLREAGRLDLISRFTLRRVQFRGLSTKDDIQALLAAIDQQEHPPASNCTWTQFFVPKAWQQGFRMKDQADTLVQGLRQRLPGQSLARGVSARQLFLAIRRFLIDYADIEAKGGNLPENLWHTAIDYALIKDAAEIAAEDKRKRRGRVRL